MDTLTVQVWKLDFAAHRWMAQTATGAEERKFTSPNVKFVALALARRSRETGACWARQATISADTGVSKQTVSRALAEMEDASWIRRLPRKRADGTRSSDLIWLTLPQVVLESTTVDPKQARDMDLEEDQDGPGPITVMGGPHQPDSLAAPPRGGGPPKESTQKESLKESEKDSSEGGAGAPAGGVSDADINTAVELIWKSASQRGRERSSRADIAKGIRGALGRGHTIEVILKGMGGYLRSEDATKEDGAFQRGAHVVLANDRFLSFVDEPRADPATPAESAARDLVGTIDAPGEELQRTWMELFVQGMPWNPERGPRPGMLGCRVLPAIQRAHGVEPYADPSDAGDGAAFD